MCVKGIFIKKEAQIYQGEKYRYLKLENETEKCFFLKRRQISRNAF